MNILYELYKHHVLPIELHDYMTFGTYGTCGSTVPVWSISKALVYS